MGSPKLPHRNPPSQPLPSPTTDLGCIPKMEGGGRLSRREFSPAILSTQYCRHYSVDGSNTVWRWRWLGKKKKKKTIWARVSIFHLFI